MKPVTVSTLAGVLVLSVVGLALGQSSAAPGNQGDELHYHPEGEQNSSPSSETTIINDSSRPSTPTYDNSNNRNQLQPFQPHNNDDQERPNQRRRVRPPFNPFGFLLTPPIFDSDSFSADPSDFSPFRQSPLLDLLGGRGSGSLFDMPNPSDFRAHMDDQIKDMSSKPDIWAKEVRQYTINGVQYEKITFTRKVDGQQQQQQQQPEKPAQIEMEQKGEQEGANQRASEQRQRSALFNRPSFARSLSNLI